jgi:hypothetical protein
MKKTVLPLTIFIILLTILSSCQTSQNIKTQNDNSQYIYVTANGYGINKDDAINDAKLKALEEGVGAYISGKTLVVNYHLVDKSILKRVRGVILGYKVLSVEQFRQDTVKVSVKFKISPKMVNEAYWEIIREMDKPRVAIIIPEKIGSKKVSDPVSQDEMIKEFLKYDFRVVDKDTVNNMKIREAATLALNGDKNSINKLKQELGVDILIIGKGSASDGGNVMGLQTASANVSARAIWLSNGEVIYADSVRAGSPGLNLNDAGKMALKKAGNELSDLFIKEILKKWMNELANGRTITVLFNGVKSYSQAEEIKNILMKQSGVIDVLERSYQNGIFRCDIIFNGSSSILAQKIKKYLNKDNPTIVSMEVLHLVIKLK